MSFAWCLIYQKVSKKIDNVQTAMTSSNIAEVIIVTPFLLFKLLNSFKVSIVIDVDMAANKIPNKIETSKPSFKTNIEKPIKEKKGTRAPNRATLEAGIRYFLILDKLLSRPAININAITPIFENKDNSWSILIMESKEGPMSTPASNCPTTEGIPILVHNSPLIKASSNIIAIFKYISIYFILYIFLFICYIFIV